MIPLRLLQHTTSRLSIAPGELEVKVAQYLHRDEGRCVNLHIFDFRNTDGRTVNLHRCGFHLGEQTAGCGEHGAVGFIGYSEG